MNHYKTHIAIAFILCFVGFFIAEPLRLFAMNYIIPSHLKACAVSPTEVVSKAISFNFYFGLFIASSYLLYIWQKKQPNFKWHFLTSMVFSTIVIVVTMHYYRLKMQQFDQITTELSKSIPNISRSVSLPNISMIPLMGLIFIVFYFCLRLLLVTGNNRVLQ